MKFTVKKSQYNENGRMTVVEEEVEASNFSVQSEGVVFHNANQNPIHYYTRGDLISVNRKANEN